MARKRIPGTETAPADNPFTEDHYQLANTMLQAHARASQLFTKLAAAGFPVQDMQAEIDQHAALATGVKQHFFPHRP